MIYINKNIINICLNKNIEIEESILLYLIDFN